MKRVSATILAISVMILCSQANAQDAAAFSLKGILQLVDRPPDSTPVEALIFRLHPLAGGFDIEAHTGRDGSFAFEQVKPGRYSLDFPMPGRIKSFVYGGEELAADGFTLNAGTKGDLLLVVSMEEAEIPVRVVGLPTAHGDVVALLVPADNHLTLRYSCFSNPLTDSQTVFRFVPPGKYRIFIIDARFQTDVATYAPRSPDFLQNEATVVQASGSGPEVSATYLSGDIVKAAIHESGPFERFAKPK